MTHYHDRYPTCSIKNPSDHHDQFEGPCEFNANILKQDCGVQFAWFKTTYVCSNLTLNPVPNQCSAYLVQDDACTRVHTYTTLTPSLSVFWQCTDAK